MSQKILWSNQSLDMNLIKHVWAILNDEIKMSQNISSCFQYRWVRCPAKEDKRVNV